MTDLTTGSVKSIVPKFKAHVLEIAIIVMSFLLAAGFTFLTLLGGWPIKYAVIAAAVYAGSFAYAAVRKWNAEGWPEWTQPFLIVGGFFSVFFGWWAMPLENNPEKRGLIISGRLLIATCVVITTLAVMASGWLPWGVIAIFISLLLYGKATATFLGADSDDDAYGEYEIVGEWPKDLKNPD